MPLDLSPIQEFLEGEMEATQIRVLSDPQGIEDDTFDPITMEYVQIDPADVATIYAGDAILIANANQPAPVEVGGGKFERTFYRMRVPLSAPRFSLGDQIEITANLRDPNMVGAFFYIIEVTETTFAVSGLYQVKRLRPKPTSSIVDEPGA